MFLVFGVTMFFHSRAWFLNDLFDWNTVWAGFRVVTVFLFLLAALAGFLAFRLFKKGAPPTPEMAIEEAKRTRATSRPRRSSATRWPLAREARS